MPVDMVETCPEPLAVGVPVRFGRFRATPSSRDAAGARGPGSTLVEGFGPVPDDHPKDAFFTSPLRVTDLTGDTEDHPDGMRAAFVATVRDAEGRRCPEIAVHARITGPHRLATGMGHTSMMGTVTFRMAGPVGTYTCQVEDVAGGALGLDLEASTLTATVDARPEPT